MYVAPLIFDILLFENITMTILIMALDVGDDNDDGNNVDLLEKALVLLVVEELFLLEALLQEIHLGLSRLSG